MKASPFDVVIRYRNHRGEVADRLIYPMYVWFSEVEWHPGAQWLLNARDIEKDAVRTFAMKDILSWTPATEAPR